MEIHGEITRFMKDLVSQVNPTIDIRIILHSHLEYKCFHSALEYFCFSTDTVKLHFDR